MSGVGWGELLVRWGEEAHCQTLNWHTNMENPSLSPTDFKHNGEGGGIFTSSPPLECTSSRKIRTFLAGKIVTVV